MWSLSHGPEGVHVPIPGPRPPPPPNGTLQMGCRGEALREETLHAPEDPTPSWRPTRGRQQGESWGAGKVLCAAWSVGHL